MFFHLNDKLIFLIHQPYFSGQSIAIYFTSQRSYANIPETLIFIAGVIISKISGFQSTWLAQSVEHWPLILGSWVQALCWAQSLLKKNKISAFQLIPHTEAKMIYQGLSGLYDCSFQVKLLVAILILWIKLLSTRLIAASSQVLSNSLPLGNHICQILHICQPLCQTLGIQGWIEHESFHQRVYILVEQTDFYMLDTMARFNRWNNTMYIGNRYVSHTT